MSDWDDMFEKPDMVDVTIPMSPLDEQVLERIAKERGTTIQNVIRGMIRDGLAQPHFHLCLLHPSCWMDWWHYGMPLRIHFTPKNRSIMLTILSGKWRHGRVWETEPVKRKKSVDVEMTGSSGEKIITTIDKFPQEKQEP